MSRHIRKFDDKVQGQIHSAYAAVVDLDANVMSDEEYLLIKDKNLNDESDLRYVADHILKSRFLSASPDARREMIQSIDFVLTSELDLVEVAFEYFGFFVEDKSLFLMRIKSILKSYCQEEG